MSPKWKNKYGFPAGAVLLIFFQWISGMGAYCYILAMPIYMASILGFSDTHSTMIYHAKSGISYLLNIFGAIVADSLLGRLKTYLYIQPFDLIFIAGISILSIYTIIPGIIIVYFGIAILGGLVGPALRTFIADQIPSNNLVMLSTYMHIIYLVNNFGVIIIAFMVPILHKDVFCFGMECYPLVFAVSFMLTTSAFILFVSGYCCNIFVVNKKTNNLFVNIFRCVTFAVRKRIKLGKHENGKGFLDYAEGHFDASLIRDIKISKGLCIFLLAHPLFWTVFEQVSSIWTLQAQYMNGMVTDTFVIKPDQMQTLNPVLVVILIPIFEILIYPLLNKINFKIPYRIVSGQIFTALACFSMIFIQFNIDNSMKPQIPSDKRQFNIGNFYYSNISFSFDGDQRIEIPKSVIISKTINKESYVRFQIGSFNLNKSLENYGNILSTIITHSNVSHYNVFMSNTRIQENGGYTSVRSVNLINQNSNITIRLKAKFGINKNYNLYSKYQDFGEYVKCGIGIYDIFMKRNPKEEYIGNVTLYAAESKTLIIEDIFGFVRVTEMSETKLHLTSIFWQIIPYVLITAGEVLFNVNTGIFLYGEAPMSMKSIILAGQYVCIAIGNILIILLKYILNDISNLYLFLICGVLVTISGILTGVLGYFYLKKKESLSEDIDSCNVSKL